MAVLSTLAACAGTPTSTASRAQSSSRYAGLPSGRYHVRNDHPPGPPEDPWGPYIKEASGRFGLPENWIRQVMRVESGGQQNLYGTPTTSPVGAMGLMQVMPATYGDLKLRYNLGDDPYDPHDNIMAGTGYLREMYDRFGSPNFLAAYNAGPRRVDDYVAGNARLPTETVNYVAAIAPRLGGGVVTDGDGNADPNILYAAQTGINGPIVQVANASPPPAPAAASAPVSYTPPPDPIVTAIETSTPASPAYSSQSAPPAYSSQAAPPVYSVKASPPAYAAEAPVYAVQASPPPTPSSSGPSAVAALVQAAERQPVAAPPPAPAYAVPPSSPPYTPTAASGYSPPARSEPRMVLIQSPRPPVGGFTQVASAEAPAARNTGSSNWAVQVGAYTTSAQANAAALSARSAAGPLLRNTAPSVGIATRPDGSVLFRARLAGITADTAEKACGVLTSHQIACASVPPT